MVRGNTKWDFCCESGFFYRTGNKEDELHKFKEGTLHSGSKKGPKVMDRKQAIAIALSEAGLSKKGKERTAKKKAKK